MHIFAAQVTGQLFSLGALHANSIATQICFHLFLCTFIFSITLTFLLFLAYISARVTCAAVFCNVHMHTHKCFSFCIPIAPIYIAA